MKRRILDFKMFKESYVGKTNEFEDDMLSSDDSTEQNDTSSIPALDDDTLDAEGGDPDTEDLGTGEDDEENELTDKVISIISESYMDTLTDLVKGIHGELGEEEDKDAVIDAILDAFETKITEILTAGDEDEDEDEDEDSEGADGETEDDDMSAEGDVETAEEEEIVSFEDFSMEDYFDNTVTESRKFSGKVVNEAKGLSAKIEGKGTKSKVVKVGASKLDVKKGDSLKKVTSTPIKKK